MILCKAAANAEVSGGDRMLRYIKEPGTSRDPIPAASLLNDERVDESLD